MRPQFLPSAGPLCGPFFDWASVTRPDSYRSITISSGITAAAGRTPGRVAIEEGARRLTFAQLCARMYRVANGVRELGGNDAAQQPRVGLLMPNCLEFIEILCGASAAGGIAVLLNPGATPNELKYLISDSELDLLVAHPSMGPVLESIQVDDYPETLTANLTRHSLRQRQPHHPGSGSRSGIHSV